MILRSALLVAFAALLASPAEANLVWSYRSTDGADTVEGLLTTTGSAGDQSIVSLSFDLVSIDTVVLNGDLLDSPSDWGTIGPFGSIPPFATSVLGDITVDTPGIALISSGALFAAGDLNSVVLADPLGSGDTEVRFDGGLGSIADFKPTDTTLFFLSVASIPEPSTFFVFGLVGIGMVAVRRQAFDA